MFIKNTLVTGNLGYIGPVLTQHLVNCGHKIHGYDIGWFESCNISDMFSYNPMLQNYKNIRDICSQDLIGIDSVVHLCAS